MNQLTVKEALKVVLENLGKVKPPMELFDEIVVPIHDSMNLLKECVSAMERAEAEALEKAAKEAAEKEAAEKMGDVDFGKEVEPEGEEDA